MLIFFLSNLFDLYIYFILWVFLQSWNNDRIQYLCNFLKCSFLLYYLIKMYLILTTEFV